MMLFKLIVTRHQVVCTPMTESSFSEIFSVNRRVDGGNVVDDQVGLFP